MTTPTPEQLLDLELPENPSGATTVRGYLLALLRELWDKEEMFSGKRPFGYSGWCYDVYTPMVRAGIVPGTLDEDGQIAEFDFRPADALIQEAIRALGDSS